MTPDKPFLIYLLHALLHDGRVTHYLGSTTPRRLKERLREHARGAGSSHTAYMATHAEHMHLVEVWPAETRAEEKEIKRKRHLKRLCRLCSQGMAVQPTVIIPCEPKPILNRAVWLGSWGQAPSPGASSTETDPCPIISKTARRE